MKKFKEIKKKQYDYGTPEATAHAKKMTPGQTNEGTWAIPKTPKDKEALKKLMSKPIKLGKEGDEAASKIYSLVGDDELFDDLYVAGKKNSNGDARPVIKKHMKRLGIKEEVELNELRQSYAVVDTADGNKVVGTASDEKGAKSIITTSQLPPMKIKDKKTLKIVKVKKKQMIGFPIKEEKDPNEYDKEGDMMKNQLRQICSANEKLMSMVGDDDNLPEWVQNKVTKATDYIRSVRDYLEAENGDDEKEMDEAKRTVTIDKPDSLASIRVMKPKDSSKFNQDKKYPPHLRGDSVGKARKAFKDMKRSSKGK